MVYIYFLISRVHPVHSFFQKKSILIKSDTKFSSTYFFHAYLMAKSTIFSILLQRNKSMTRCYKGSKWKK